MGARVRTVAIKAWYALALCVGASVILQGCEGSIEQFFERPKPTLKGDRVAMELPGTKHSPQDKTMVRAVVLPAPVLNLSWEQVGRVASHEQGHVALPRVLRPLWTFSTESGCEVGRPLSAPVAAENALFFLGTDGMVRAIALCDGRLLWDTSVVSSDRKAGLGIGGGVAFGNGCVYVTTGHGELFALDAKTGKAKWHVPLAAPARGAPAFSDGTLFVLGLDNRIEAFCAKTGRSLWGGGGVPEDTGLLGSSTPAVKNGVVVVGYSSGEIATLRQDGGEVLWSGEATDAKEGIEGVFRLLHVRAAPVICDTDAYVLSYGGRFASFDLRDGSIRWKRAIGGASTPCVSGDFVFVVSTGVTGSDLICLDRCTGGVCWKHALPEVKDSVVPWVGPVLAGGLVYVVGITGKILAFDPMAHGKLVQQYNVGQPMSIPPIVVAEKLCVVTERGDIVLYGR